MAPPPQSQRHGGGVIEGIYVLELGKPLREWVPLALPPGRTLQATLAAGLPTPGPARPGPPQLPPLGADPKSCRVRVVFGNGTIKDVKISQSVLDAYDVATIGILAKT